MRVSCHHPRIFLIGGFIKGSKAISGELWLHFAHVVVQRLPRNQKLVRNVVLPAMECPRPTLPVPAEATASLDDKNLTTNRLEELPDMPAYRPIDDKRVLQALAAIAIHSHWLVSVTSAKSWQCSSRDRSNNLLRLACACQASHSLNEQTQLSAKAMSRGACELDEGNTRRTSSAPPTRSVGVIDLSADDRSARQGHQGRRIGLRILDKFRCCSQVFAAACIVHCG